MRAALASALLLLVASRPALALEGTTNNQLLESCDQKMIVTGYDESGRLKQVGESLDGFCEGFIRATYAAFSSINKCASYNNDPNLLLSIYRTYLKDVSPAIDDDAFQTLYRSFSRIATCNRQKPQATTQSLEK